MARRGQPRVVARALGSRTETEVGGEGSRVCTPDRALPAPLRLGPAPAAPRVSGGTVAGGGSRARLGARLVCGPGRGRAGPGSAARSEKRQRPAARSAQPARGAPTRRARGAPWP